MSSGQALAPAGATIVGVLVTAQDGISTKSYSIIVNREANTASPTAIPPKPLHTVWMWGMETDGEDNPVPSEDPETFIE